MECPNCKRVIVPGLKFCGGCGMSVNALLSGETGKPKNIEKPKASLSSLSSIFKKKDKGKKTIEELLEEQAGEKNAEATASDSQKTTPVAAPVDSPATNREVIEPDVDEEITETQDATVEATVSEEPAVEATVAEEPVVEEPVVEEPVVEEPVVEAPVAEEPVVEAPAFEVPVYEEPKYEAPTEPVKVLFDTDVTPTYEAPVFTAPSYEEPKYEEPVETPAPVEEPVAETPVFEVPVYEEPKYEAPTEPVKSLFDTDVTPTYEAPVYTVPSYEEPKYEEPVETSVPVEEPVAETPSYEAPVYTAPSYEEPKYEEPKYEEPKYEEPVEASSPVEEPVAETPSYTEPVEEKKEEPKSFFTADGNPIPAAPVTPPPIKKTEEEPKSEYSSFFDSLYSDDYQSVTPPNNTINKKSNNNGEKVYLCPKCNTKVIPGLQYCTGCAIALDKVTLVEESHVDKSFDVIRDGNGPSGYSSMPMYEPERSYVKDIKRKKSPLPTLLALAFILGVAAYLIFFVFRPFAPYKKALDSFFNGVSKMDLNEIVESVVPDEYFKSLNTNSTQMLDYFTKALQVASSTSNIKFVYRIKSEHKIASDDYNEYLQAIMNVTKKNIDKAYSLTLKVSASMNSGEKVNKQAKVMDFIAYQMDGKWYVLPSPTK